MKSKLLVEILDKKRQDVFSVLSAVFGDDYYLAGGTALALQIGHRQSFDFDLFQDKDISFQTKRKILKTFNGYSIQTLVDTSDELTVVLDGEVKLTFLNYYWKPLFPLVKFPKVLPLLSIKEIAVTKAYALGRRGNYRDYFDLYVIIKNGFASIKEIIKWAKKKYGEIFSERMFLEQLIYLEDIQLDNQLIFLKEKEVSPKVIAGFFTKKIAGMSK